MSSMKTMTNLSSSGMKTKFMRYMKCAGAFFNPNDMTRYSYRSYLVEKALADIFGTNLDLVIPRAKINLGEHLSSR
jgi:hypothetical protein